MPRVRVQVIDLRESFSGVLLSPSPGLGQSPGSLAKQRTLETTAHREPRLPADEVVQGAAERVALADDAALAVDVEHHLRHRGPARGAPRAGSARPYGGWRAPGRGHGAGSSVAGARGKSLRGGARPRDTGAGGLELGVWGLPPNSGRPFGPAN